MFYATSILSKKGPLGVIWIAAHLDRRLKRHQINETSITNSVDSIINPEAPLALRLSGQLMLGVVRIYSRKVGYLYQDTNEALLKIQQAFRDHAAATGKGDTLTLPATAITLADELDDYELLLSAAPASFDAQLGGLTQLDAPVASRRESLSMSVIEDLSAAFGSQPGMEDELFEVAGDELERRISMAMEVEQLRRDSSRRPSALFEGIVGRPSSPGPVPSALRSTGAGGGALEPDASVGGGTPGSVGGGHADAMLPDFDADMLPDVAPIYGNDDAQPASSAAAHEHPPSPMQPEATSVQLRAGRKRKLVIDAIDGRPAVDMDGRTMRALMVDRAPLLTRRGWHGPDAAADMGLLPDTIMGPAAAVRGTCNAPGGEAGGRPLERPAVVVALNAKLAGLFAGMVRLPCAAEMGSPAKRARHAADNDAPPSTARRRRSLGVQPPDADPWMQLPMQDNAPMFADDPVGPVDDMPPLDDGPWAGDVAHTPLPPAEEGGAWTSGAAGAGLVRAAPASGVATAPENADQGFTSRSRAVLATLEKRAAAGEARTSIGALAAGNSRVEAARLFFEALVLHSKGLVRLEQDSAYGDVQATVVAAS